MIWYDTSIMDAHEAQTEADSPSPAGYGEERCSRCGAVLTGKDVGDEVCYCPSCGNFVAPLDNDKKPWLEARADIIAHPPRGISLDRDTSGRIAVRDCVPRFWIVATIVLPFVLAAAVFAVINSFNSLDYGNRSIADAFSGVLVGSVAALLWLIALCRLKARRLSLNKAEIIVDTLWLGFLRVMRRRFALRENATAAVTKICDNKDRVKAISVGLSIDAGTQLQVVWSERGRRNEERATFIHAVLDAHLGRAEGGTPYLCAKCGTAIPHECINAKSELLTCPVCKAEWPGPYAHCYRAHACQSQQKFRPHLRHRKAPEEGRIQLLSNDRLLRPDAPSEQSTESTSHCHSR